MFIHIALVHYECLLKPNDIINYNFIGRLIQYYHIELNLKIMLKR